MPVITNIPTETAAFSDHPASQNKLSSSPLTENIDTAVVSVTGLVHHSSAQPQASEFQPENRADAPDNIKSRLLSVEEYEQFEAEKKRQRLPSCHLSIVIAGAALMTAIGAFAYNRLRAGSNSLANSATTLAPVSENVPSDIYFPQAQALSARAPAINSEHSLRHDKKKAHKLPCNLFATEIKDGIDVPCKQGKGEKHWPDIATLPTCSRRKVVNRCKRKQARTHKAPGQLVINRKGKRCVCAPATRREPPDITQSPGQSHYPPLKRGNEYRYVDEIPSAGKIKTSTSTPTTTPDYVAIQKIFDQTCVDERANLSKTQMLRQVGKTLSTPISEAYKEGRIAYDYIIKKTGCTSPEALAEAMKITAAVDFAVSSVVSLIPGSEVIIVAQNIIGPILELIADSLEGQELDILKVIDIEQQILFMMRPTIPTMNRNEQASLYGKLAKGVDIPKVETSILTKRYTFHDNKPYVKIADKEYVLRKSIDNRPFVERNRFIHFNQRYNNWEFVESAENDIFSKLNMQNRDDYGISLEQLPDYASIEFNEYDFITIRTADKKETKGVFLSGKFVPADWDHVAGEFVAYTHDGNYLEQRVITFSDYGWVFERPSVKMDKNLKLYLESYETGIDYYPENRISAMNNENGLCHNEQKINFLKKDYQYYELEKVGGESDTYVLANDPYTQIKLENGVFKLKYADNMLFGLQSERIPGALNEKDAFYLETTTQDYLLDHAVTTQAEPVRAIRPGLYVDKTNKPLFIMKDKKFVVNKHTDRYVYLQREQDGLEGDIALWSDNESWIHVRDDEPLASEYHDVSTCRIARAPGGGKGCLPVVIEKDLHLRLQKHIDDKTTSNYYPVPGALRQLKTYDTPVVFQDINTQKNYFLYAGKYFDAKLVDTLDASNPTGLPVIRVSGKGNFFKREKIIADIILEQREERIEIKEMDTFVAEKIKVNKDIARFYNKNRRYRYQPAISSVENVVNEVQSSGKIYVAPHPQVSTSAKEIPDISTHYNTVKQELFPPRIVKSKDHEIVFKKLDSPADPLDTRMQQAQQYVEEQIQYIKEKVMPDVQTALSYGEYSWADAGLYLSVLLDSSDTRFLTDAAEALRQDLQSVSKSIDPQEIYLVKAVNKYAKAARNMDANPYQSLQERHAGKTLLVSDKGDKRIFINVDKLALENAQRNADVNLVGLIIEEALSTQKQKSDFFNMDRVSGVYPAASDMVDEMINKIETQSLTSSQLRNLKDVSRAYLENVPAYKPHLNELMTPQKLAYLARNDRGYLAHLLLHSSPCLTVMTEDIYSQLAQAKFDSAKNDAWVTNYINKRELNTLRKETAMSTTGLDIDKLAMLNTADMDISAVGGKPRIYYTEPGLDLLYKTGGNYYPVEFIGKNNRVVFVGPQDKVRHVYYYNPQNGELTPLQRTFAKNNELSYNRHLDLYQSVNTNTGESSVLKYDTQKELLVPTGAKKITPLVNNVIKVEYQHFELFYPEEASDEIFLAAHGSRQINLKNTRVPENAKVFFYTKRWHSLNGHMDDLIELVKGKIPSVESRDSWEQLETYDITLDQDSQINYPYLAKESRKGLIRIKPDTEVSSKALIDGISNLFSDKKINIHLYICRSI